LWQYKGPNAADLLHTGKHSSISVPVLPGPTGIYSFCCELGLGGKRNEDRWHNLEIPAAAAAVKPATAAAVAAAAFVQPAA
jgi:hypothetical protein